MDLLEAESILLALVAKADDRLRNEESKAAERILYRDGDDNPHDHWQTALLHTDEAEAAIIVLSAQPEEKRISFMADLWEVAVSDFEVSRTENNVIFTIAHKLGVRAYPEGATLLPVAEDGATETPAETDDNSKKLVPGPFSNLVFFAIVAVMLFLIFFAGRIWNALT